MAKAVQARPHRPVYRMHRYFARRPYSVFAEMVDHYSNPGDVILDPFCGGGVTLVEGVLQQRRVIGFDLNPMATTITRMQLADVDIPKLTHAAASLMRRFRPECDRLFATTCRTCRSTARALWFEYSCIAQCPRCATTFPIASATKATVGAWKCTKCTEVVRFSPRADARSTIVTVHYTCTRCGTRTGPGSAADQRRVLEIDSELQDAEARGLWIPTEPIPDCNMQRESALFKKGILLFRQLFTPRTLLALGLLKKMIADEQVGYRDWLLFTFSATLRYTNRMVTRNPGWRGTRPLEWAKPGFWLPPVYVDANVAEEFQRRLNAVVRGKTDFQTKCPTPPAASMTSTQAVLKSVRPAYHVGCRSSTKVPLPDGTVDVILTDPPYGSYVHYADLCNFWAVWLPELGMGTAIDNREEAVIARKRFPGAKSTHDYQRLLERCFSECARVLKTDGYMVLTFNNREPRAWGSLLVAAAKAGFDLPERGVVFQDGIDMYRHTAQSRRAGSVIGDFILSFKKGRSSTSRSSRSRINGALTDSVFVREIRAILRRERRPLRPDELMRHLYVGIQPTLMSMARQAVANGNEAIAKLLEQFDDIGVLDSHRRLLLERHFDYKADRWSLRGSLAE